MVTWVLVPPTSKSSLRVSDASLLVQLTKLGVLWPVGKEEAPANGRRIGLSFWQMHWSRTSFFLSPPTPSFLCFCCVSFGS